MATRNLTAAFKTAKAINSEKPKSQSVIEIKSETYTKHFMEIDALHVQINSEIVNAEKMYSKLVTDVFSKLDYNEELKNILSNVNKLFDEARKLFNQTKIMASQSIDPHKTIITNMHKQKVKKFQTLVSKFQKIKSEYVKHLKLKNESAKKADEFFNIKFDRFEDDDTKTQTQIHDSYEHEYEIMQERNKEIAELCESMTDLHRIYQDLSEMILNQGEMLDRIDKTLEETVVTTTKGTEQLKKAEESQKKCSVM